MLGGALLLSWCAAVAFRGPVCASTASATAPPPAAAATTPPPPPLTPTSTPAASTSTILNAEPKNSNAQLSTATKAEHELKLRANSVIQASRLLDEAHA